MKTQFTEKQRFTQWWLWAIMLGLFVVPIVVLFKEGLSESIISFVVIGFCNLLFFLLKLSTNIDSSGIKISFFPLVKKVILWSEIKSLKVFDYGFIGGWGIRPWTQYGTVYNIRGSKGLLVELNDGKTFVIGSQREQELKEVLVKLGKISE